MNFLLLIILRILHVVGGALWESGAVFFRFFINPAVVALGAEGLKFGQSLNERGRFSKFMGAITSLNILSGFALFYFGSGGLKWVWVMSDPGIGFSAGALSGISAYIIGGFGMSRTSARLRSASLELEAFNNSESSALISRVESLKKTHSFYEPLDFWLLAAAMLLMATARYWNF